MNPSYISILNIKGADYQRFLVKLAGEGITLMQNIDLIKKLKHYKTQQFVITYTND